MKGSRKLLIAGLIAAGATSATLYFRNPFVDRVPESTPLQEVQPKSEQDKRISALLSDLRSGDPSVRSEAASHLSFKGNSRAVPALVKALRDEDRDVRVHAAEGLGSIGDKSAVVPLIEALNRKDNSKEEAQSFLFMAPVSFMDYVARALGDLKDPTATPYLVNLLADPKYSSLEIAEAIGKIDDPRSVPYIIQALTHQDKEVRSNAVLALKDSKDERAVEPLFNVLKNEPDDYVRGHSAIVLANFPNNRVIQGLIEAAEYTTSSAKMQVIEALGKTGDLRAIPTISQALTSDDANLVESAAQAVESLCAKNEGNLRLALLIGPFQENFRCHRYDTRYNSAADDSYRAYETLKKALSMELVEYSKSAKEETDPAAKLPSAQTTKTSEISGLIGKLSSTDEVTRGEAAEKLGDLREPTAVPYLAGLLNDRSAFVRLCSCYALGNIGDERAVPALAGSLAEIAEPVSLCASWGLAKIGRPSLPVLIDLLYADQTDFESELAKSFIFQRASESDKALAREYRGRNMSIAVNKVIATIGEIGDPLAVPDLIEIAYRQKGVGDILLNAFTSIGEPAVPDLVAALDDKRNEVKGNAAFLLGKIKSKTATIPLIQHLGEKDDAVVLHVISALGEIGDSTATPGLLSLIEKKHPKAWYAVESLGKIGDPAAVPLLYATVYSNGIWNAKDITEGWSATDSLNQNAFEALGEIGGPAVPILLQALDSDNSAARQYAAEALGLSRDNRAVSALIDALEDDDVSVRHAALEALVKIRDPRIVPALIDLLDDDDMWWGAAEALGEIGDKSALPALERLAEDIKYQQHVGNAIRDIREGGRQHYW